METTFSTAFSTSPLAAGGGGAHAHPHHLFSTNSLHLQGDSNNPNNTSGSGGGVVANGSNSGTGGGGGGAMLSMMMNGNEPTSLGGAFYSSLGGARRVTEPSSTHGGGANGGLMWMMGGAGTNSTHPTGSGGGAPTSHFQLSTTFDADPYSDKVLDSIHRTFNNISSEMHSGVAAHEPAMGTMGSGCMESGNASGGGSNGSANGGGVQGSNPPPSHQQLHSLQQQQQQQHSVLLPLAHGPHSRFYPAPPSPSSHSPGSLLPLSHPSHLSGSQGISSASYSMSPTGGSQGGSGTAVHSQPSPVLPPQLFSSLVDPHYPEESAMRLNDAVTKYITAYHHHFHTHQLPPSTLDTEAFAKEIFESIASTMTTPAHLAIVALLQERYRKEVRDLVLQSCMSQLGSVCEEGAGVEGECGGGTGGAATGLDGEVIPHSAEILVEMAKLHLVRLSGVIAVVNSFLEKPYSQRVGLAVLGRMMAQLRHNDRFLSSVRANGPIMLQLYNLHRVPEFEYDVLAITQFLLPSPSSRRSTAGGDGGSSPHSSSSSKNNNSSGNGTRNRTGEHNTTAALYEGPVLKHVISTNGPFGVGTHLPLPQQQRIPPQPGQLVSFANVPTTRMVYFSRQDELMTAHVDGTVVLWGEPDNTNTRGKTGEEKLRGSTDGKEEDDDMEDDTGRRNRANGGEEEEEEENSQDKSSDDVRMAGGRKREWTSSKGTLEMPNDCVAWAMAGHRSGRYLALAGHPPLAKSPYNRFFHSRRSALPTVVATTSTTSRPPSPPTTTSRHPVLFVLGFSEANQQWTSAQIVPRPQSAVITTLTALSQTTMCFAESRIGSVGVGSVMMGSGESPDVCEDGTSAGHQLILMDPMSSHIHRVLPNVHSDYTTVLSTPDHPNAADHVLYSGSRDKLVKVYDVRSQDAVVATMRAHQDTISAIALHHQHLVLSSSLDGMLYAWDSRRLSEPLFSRVFSSPVLDMVALKPTSNNSNSSSYNNNNGNSAFSNGNSNSGSNPSGIVGGTGGASTPSDLPQLAVSTTRALYLLNMLPMDAADIIPNCCFTQLKANDEGSVLFALDTEGVHTFAVKRGLN